MSAPADPHVLRFVPDLPGDAGGPLAGLRIAVKDNFDVAGHVTGAGHPQWARDQVPATRTAAVVARLQAAGAALTGKTQMDELAYSLMGQNAFYGTPPNPAAPDRMPGGSSSGSASAVASGLADAGLGSDTGGSVRIPAAFCGLWGWRPTHGALPSGGMVPLAPSYDVPGVMTRDAETLLRIARALLGGRAEGGRHRLVAPRDLWAIASGRTADALSPWRELAEGDEPLFSGDLRDLLLPTFRICQGVEVAREFGPWIERASPEFGPGVADRFAMAMAITPEAAAAARADRDRLRDHVRAFLGETRALIVPTAPGPAPFLTTGGAEMEDYRNRALSLLSVAGHAGLPQVTRPAGELDGAPLGVSLIGPAGSDLALIEMAEALSGTNDP